jgi:ATP-dependent DNA helicase RecG
MVQITESARYRELRLGRSNQSHDNATDATETATENATETATEKVLLALISENPHVTQSELAKKTGKHRVTVARRMKALKDAGVLVRVGSDTQGHWEIVG